MNSLNANSKIENIEKVCRNLAGRFARIKEMQFRDKKFETLSKAFIKKYRERKNKDFDPSKISLFKLLEQNSKSFLSSYHTAAEFVKDYVLFVSVVQNFLIDLTSSSIIIKYEINPGLVVAIMDMIVSYSKLVVLMCTSNQVFYAAVLYLFSYKVSVGHLEPDHHAVMQFCCEIKSSIFRNQCHFINFGVHIAQTIKSNLWVLKWADENFSNTKLFTSQHFAMSEKAASALDKQCDELLLYYRLTDWIIFGLLMSFKELTNKILFDALKSILLQFPFCDIGYGIRVKMSEIYLKMTDYASALKISGYKAILKENQKGDLMIRAIDRVSVITKRVNLLTYLLGEKPFLHAQKTKVLLTALKVLSNETFNLIHSVVDPFPVETEIGVFDKKIFFAIQALSRLFISLKTYSPLVKEVHQQILKNEMMKSLEAELQKVEKMHLIKNHSEMLENVAFIKKSICSGDFLNDSEAAIVAKTNISRGITLISFIINQETHERLIGSQNDEDSRQSLAREDSMTNSLNILDDTLFEINLLYNYDYYLDNFCDIGRFIFYVGLTTTFKKMMQTFEKNENEICLGLLDCFMGRTDDFEEISEMKAKVLIFLLNFLSKVVANVLVQNAKKLSLMEESEKKEEQISHLENEGNLKTCLYMATKLTRKVCDFPVMHFGNVVIDPGPFLLHRLYAVYVKLVECTLQVKKELSNFTEDSVVVWDKLMIVMNVWFSFEQIIGRSLKEQAKFALATQFSLSNSEEVISQYLDNMFTTLYHPNIGFSRSQNQFVDLELQCPNSLLRDSSLRHFSRFIGIYGLKILSSHVYAKTNSLFMHFVNSLQELKNVIQDRNDIKSIKKQIKKINTVVSVAISIGKTQIFFEKIARFANLHFKHNFKFLDETIRFLCKELADGDSVESALYLAPFMPAEQLLQRVVQSMNSNVVLSDLECLTPLLFYGDAFARAQYIKPLKVFSTNLFLVIDVVLAVTQHLEKGDGMLRRLTLNCSLKLFELLQSHQLEQTKEPFSLFFLIKHMEESLTADRGLDFDMLCPLLLTSDETVN